MLLATVRSATARQVPLGRETLMFCFYYEVVRNKPHIAHCRPIAQAISSLAQPTPSNMHNAEVTSIGAIRFIRRNGASHVLFFSVHVCECDARAPMIK